MFVDLSVHIDYACQATPESVACVLIALREVVSADPSSLGHLQACLPLSDVRQAADEIYQILFKARQESSSVGMYASFHLTFSQLAPASLRVRFRWYEDGSFGVILLLESDAPLRTAGTLSLYEAPVDWLARLDRPGLFVLSGGYYNDFRSETPEKVQSFWQQHDQLPETPSLWKSFEKELVPIVTGLLGALPLKSDGASDKIAVTFNCGVADPRSVVARTMNAMLEAVLENWKSRSPLPPGFWPDFEAELGLAAAANVVTEVEESGPYWNSIIGYFPDACHSMEYTISKGPDQVVEVAVSIPGTALDEVEGTRERGKMRWEWMKKRTTFYDLLPGPGDMDEATLRQWNEKYEALGNTPRIWPQNRDCFLNIVEHLKRTLDTATIELDARLQDGPTTC